MAKKKFYTFIIGAMGTSSEDAYENLYNEEYGDLDMSEIEVCFGQAFEDESEARKHYDIVDAVPEVKSVPMDEIKAIQDELHALAWDKSNNRYIDSSILTPLCAILGKLQMLTDQ